MPVVNTYTYPCPFCGHEDLNMIDGKYGIFDCDNCHNEFIRNSNGEWTIKTRVNNETKFINFKKEKK